MRLRRNWLSGLPAFLLAAVPTWAATLNVPGEYPTIADAVAAADPGDTIQIGPGAFTVSDTITIDKANLTIAGSGSDNTIVEVSAAAPVGQVFQILPGGDGATIRDLYLLKTDKNTQDLIGIQAGNVTIKDNRFSGQYEQGDGEVSRAMVISGGSNNLLIEGNMIYSLRQPAYITGPITGTVSNNLVHTTRGWVVEGGELTFTGNTWGSGPTANAVDIAILSSVSSSHYTDIPAVIAANNGARVDDQRTPPQIVYVDAAAAPGGNGRIGTPFDTIAPAISAVNAGGTILVAAGTYAENLEIDKALSLVGAGQGATVIHPAASGVGPDGGPSFGYSQVIVVSAHNVTIRDLTVDGDNPALTSGVVRHGADIDARNGIIESNGPWNGTTVHHCTIKNIYLRGLYAMSGGNDFHFHHNTVENVAGGPASIAIFNHGGKGIIEWNTVTLANDAISANWSRGTQFLNNVVTASGSGIHTDNSGDGGTAVPDVISGNTVSDSAANGYGVWVFFPYKDVVVSNNTVNNCDVGLFAWGSMGGTAQFTDNTVDAQGRADALGIYVTTGPDVWGSYQANLSVSFTNNEVKNTEYGFVVETDETAPLYSTTVSVSGYTSTNNTYDAAVSGLGTFDVSGLIGQKVYVFNPGHIQTGIGIAAAGGAVDVASGAFHQDVVVNKSLTLTGAGAAGTTLSGAIGGEGATVRISASNVTVSGFTITRDGNTVADWNDPNLNFAGVAIQGQAITGAVIHDNVITGNRTGLDINNTSGHTIRNNEVTANHTGVIFRNQTDNLTVVENVITGNRTAGIVFLDASGGTNSPVQTAQNCTFRNNNISANWYGQVVDRQVGGTLPAPGTTNLKNFSANWFGTATPVVSNANSAEPGYGDLIPVAFGGTATPPVAPQPDILGPAVANLDITPLLSTGADTDVETTPGRGTFGFQGDFSQLTVTAELAQVGSTGRVQEAIDLVSGSTVSILPGVYPDPVNASNQDNLTIQGTDANNRPELTAGIVATSADDLALRHLIVKGAAASYVIQVSGTNLTMENVTVDGESVAGRHGVGSGQINGAVSITGCEFLNIRNWAAFDTRSGSGGPESGSLLTSVVFSNNLLDNTIGHICIRGTIGAEIGSVVMDGNTVQNVGNATNSFGGILKVFYANSVTFTNNVIKDVGTSGYNPVGEAAYGAGFLPRNVANLTVTGNLFKNNNQGLAIEPRNGNPGGHADGVLPGGVIENNTFEGNVYGIYVPATLHPSSDFSGLTITGNNLVFNTAEAVHNGSTLGILNALSNNWGTAEGPLDTVGVTEVSLAACGASVADALNIVPAGLLGNKVSENVAYCPWTVPATIELLPQGGDVCLATNDTLVVEVKMSGATLPIVGGQFFLNYDAATLDYLGGVPGDAPFVTELADLEPAAGQVFYSVGVSHIGGTGTTNDTVLARLSFKVIGASGSACSANLIGFQPDAGPFQTKLSDEIAQPVFAELVALPTVSIDGTSPSLTCPTDVVVSSDPGLCTATLVPGGTAVNEPFDVNPDPGVWVTDRYAPHAFESSVFDGGNRLRHAIDVAEAQGNRPGSYSGAFYNTQGRKMALNGAGLGTTVSVDLYIPASWATQVRRADIWLRDVNPVEANARYPILGFVSKDPSAANQTDTSGTPTPRYRWWDSTTSDWVDLAVPVVYDTWHTLAITLNNAGVFEFRIDGVLVATDSAPVEPGYRAIKEVLLQAYNFGESYDVYWDNVQTNSLGGPVVSDDCPGVTVQGTRSDLQALDAPYPLGLTTITWTATDACGLVSQCTQEVVVVDTEAPVVACNNTDLMANAAAGSCSREVTWNVATASDNCVGAIDIEYEIDEGNDGSVDATQPGTTYEFPAGTHKVTARATDAAGNVGTCSFLVTINSASELVVDVKLQSVDPGPIERCITFEVWPAGCGSELVIEEIVTFTNGVGTATLTVPCGTYGCITARDRLHTLRRTSVVVDAGTVFTADFTSPTTELTGGNLNDDAYVDILDFAVYAWQFAVNYGTPNTTCATSYPHADISGNGSVGTEDFTFVSINFLKGRDANCCGAPNRDAGPLAAVNTSQLEQAGLGNLGIADLNGDKVIDQADVVLWLQGARPGQPLPTPAPAPRRR